MSDDVNPDDVIPQEGREFGNMLFALLATAEQAGLATPNAAIMMHACGHTVLLDHANKGKMTDAEKAVVSVNLAGIAGDLAKLAVQLVPEEGANYVDLIAELATCRDVAGQAVNDLHNRNRN